MIKSIKYKVYFVISVITLIGWLLLVFKFQPVGKCFLWAIGIWLVFVSFTLLQILRGVLIDLQPKEIKHIWWSYVVKILVLSAAASYFIVYGQGNLKVIINSTAFGILLGYGLTRLQERGKIKEEAKDFINGLLQEVSSNRFRCQALIAGHPPLPFDTFVWDNFRISKHFRKLWKRDKLTGDLFNLYLSLMSANWRINLLSAIAYGFLVNRNPNKANLIANSSKDFIDFLNKEVLPKLQEMEKELEAFSRDLQKELLAGF